jgi:hypothetical protein
MLDGIALRASDDDRPMAMAARYVRALAEDVWDTAERSALYPIPSEQDRLARL